MASHTPASSQRPAAEPTDTLLARIVQVSGSLLARGEAEDVEAWIALERDLQVHHPDARLTQLATELDLGSFELQVVGALLAFHVDPQFKAVCQEVMGHLAPGLTVPFLLERLCPSLEARLEARRHLRPGAPLVGTVVDLQAAGAEGFGGSVVTLAPTALNFLLDQDVLPDRVAAVARFIVEPFDLLGVIMPPALREQARELVLQHGAVRRHLKDWGITEVAPHGAGVTFLLSGPSGTGKTLFARALATDLKSPLMAVSCADLPEREVDAVLRELFVEARLRGAVVLFDECEVLFAADSPRKSAALDALDYYADGVTLLVTNEPTRLAPSLDRRILLHLPFERPSADERRQIWEVHLPPTVPLDDDVDLDVLADRYEITGGQIKNALRVAVSKSVVASPAAPRVGMRLLEQGCHTQLRSSLEDLTTRTSSPLRLSDIVLPERQREEVEAVVDAIRNHSHVMNTWGMRDRLSTGRGIVALFDGPPGTGKTLCAEIIAAEVDQPLHRINIPQVVSKWVGETEKHIQSIFREARAQRAMLLFDEADSLFARRSTEVNSANDRHANMEVNLLLQEIERFPGVAMLTTNAWGSLDPAMMRRILFRVSFVEPDVEQRERIWGKLRSPKLALAEDVELRELAERYEFTGARIKNALLKACYRASRAGGPVTQTILLEACAHEAQAAGLAIRDPRIADEARRIWEARRMEEASA